MKRLLAITLSIVLMFSLVGCTGDKDSKNKGNKNANNTSNGDNNNASYKIGDNIVFDDLQFTVKGVRTSTGDDKWNIPAEGNLYIYIDVTVENIGDEDVTVSSLMIFTLYDKEGYEADIAFVTDAKGNLDGSLAPGRKMSGEIIYQIPKDTKEFELEIKPDFLGSDAAYIPITIQEKEDSETNEE